MSGEDQERLEDYLELERYIAELQAGRAPHPPNVLTPRQERIYRMVLLFRSLSPGGAEPRPTFVRALQARLEQELQQLLETPPFLFLVRKGQKKPCSVLRRALLVGGAIATGSLMIGTCLEQVAEQLSNHKAPETTGSRASAIHSPLLNGPPVVWHFVATLALLDDERDVRPVRLSQSLPPARTWVAWSSGIIPTAHSIAPVTEGFLREMGRWTNIPAFYALSPLPRLQTKVDQGKVYVQVPVSHL